MKDTYVLTEMRQRQRNAFVRYRGSPEAFTFLDEGVGDKNFYSTPEFVQMGSCALYQRLFSAELLNQAYTL